MKKDKDAPPANAHYAPNGALCYFQSPSPSEGSLWTHNYTFNNRLQPATIQAIDDYTNPPVTQPVCGVSSVYSGGYTSSMLDLRYTFVDASGHNNGNVVSIAEGDGSAYTVTVNPYRNQSFTYDSLNRLATAKTASTYSTRAGDCWAETYNYDAWGNLLKLGPDTVNQSAYIGCTQESGFDFSAPGLIGTNNRINTSGYVYDAAGNLITSPGAGTVTFNAENQIVSAGGVTYTYDGDGKRVMKSRGASEAFGGPIGGAVLGGLAGGFVGGVGGNLIGQIACRTGTGGGSGGGAGLTDAARRKLGNLADRADETVRDVIRSRGGNASNVNQVGQWADRTLGETAEAAVRGDSLAETAIKIAKQAGRLGQKY